jgi:hypothetical protein
LSDSFLAGIFSIFLPLQLPSSVWFRFRFSLEELLGLEACVEWHNTAGYGGDEEIAGVFND